MTIRVPDVIQKLKPDDPAYKTKVATARYETETFIAAHPSYVVCPENHQALMKYLDDNDLEIDCDTLTKAYEHLAAKGVMKMTEDPRLAIAKMTASEYQAFAKEHGRPVHDEYGRLTGRYALDEEGFRIPIQDTAGRQPNDDPLPPVDDQLKHDLKHKPTKAEFATTSQSIMDGQSKIRRRRIRNRGPNRSAGRST